MSKEFKVGDEVQAFYNGNYTGTDSVVVLVDGELDFPVWVKKGGNLACFDADGNRSDYSIRHKPKHPKTEKRWVRLAKDTNGDSYLSWSSNNDAWLTDLACYISDPQEITFEIYPESE